MIAAGLNLNLKLKGRSAFIIIGEFISKSRLFHEAVLNDTVKWSKRCH